MFFNLKYVSISNIRGKFSNQNLTKYPSSDCGCVGIIVYLTLLQHDE